MFIFFILFVKYLNDTNLSIKYNLSINLSIKMFHRIEMFFNILTHSKVWSHLLILYNDDDTDSLIRTMIVFKQQCCSLKSIKISTFQLKLFLNAS